MCPLREGVEDILPKAVVIPSLADKIAGYYDDILVIATMLFFHLQKRAVARQLAQR